MRFGWGTSWLAIALTVAIGCKKADQNEQADDNKQQPASDREAEPSFPADLAGSLVALPDTAGTVAADPSHTLVRVGDREITIAGKAVVALRDGAVDAAELKGGAMGVQIVRVTRFLAALTGGPRDPKKAAFEPPSSDPVEVDIEADPDAPQVAYVDPSGQSGPRQPPLNLALPANAAHKLLLQLVASASQPPAGRTSFHLLARSAGKVVAVPLRLPDRVPASGLASARDPGGDLAAALDEVPDKPPAERPRRIVVALTTKRLLVADLDKGGLAEPLLARPNQLTDNGALPALVSTLEPLAKNGMTSVTLMADPSLPMRNVLPLIAAIRARSGSPAVYLARGFE